ncbi:outer membrane protein [Hylemonella sp. W303a]|uniref:outer membrane protein n=1 Tax=Hylemonella sp. W303a TaxID=3389873 RepID=UPI00396B2966
MKNAAPARPFTLLQPMLLCLLASAGGSHAPAALAAEWDGYSFSVLGGAPLQSSRVSAEARGPRSTSYFSQATDVTQVAAEGSGRSSGADWGGSVKMGYSWQSGNVVTGIDVSTDTGVDQSFTNRAAFASDPLASRFSITQRIKTDPVLAIRPRVGWAWDNTMVYGTVGLAAVRVSLETTYSDNYPWNGAGNASGSSSSSETKIGPVIGFGADYALSKAWSLSAQYLYADFGSVSNSTTVTHSNINTPDGRDVIDSSADLRTQSVMVGLTYRFKD